MSGQGDITKKPFVAFYVVAHPDDWFYFANTCISDAQEADSFVIILMTAGDAGKLRWGETREHALRKTAVNLLLIKDGYSGPLDSFEEEAKHSTEGYSCFTVSSTNMSVKIYTFRLPDGNIDGNGFPLTKYQSLQKCYQDKVTIQQQELRHPKEGHTLFTVKEYQYDELVSKVKEIVVKECKKNGIQDFEDVLINSTHPKEGEHADHRIVGRLSLDVSKILGCKVCLWDDYRDAEHDPNLDTFTIVGKGLLLGAYTSAIHTHDPLTFGSDGISSWKWLCYNVKLFEGKGADYEEEKVN